MPHFLRCNALQPIVLSLLRGKNAFRRTDDSKEVPYNIKEEWPTRRKGAHRSGYGRPKPLPRPALFEREVLAHHVTRELFGSRAEGVNAVAAEQVDHLLLLQREFGGQGV